VHHNTKRNRTLGGVLVLIAAILMIVSLFTAWYVYTASESVDGSTVKTTSSAFPAYSNSQNGSLQTSCTGSSFCGSTTGTSYSNAHQNNTGNLAVAAWYLVLGAFILGILGAILAIGARSKQSWVTPAIALTIIAFLLALAAPVMYAAALPGAVTKDYQAQGVSTNGSGPWSSFSGSSSSGPLSLTWGPGIGWILAIVGFVLFLIGALLLWRARKAPPAAPMGGNTCSACGMSFSTPQELEAHASTAHPPMGTPPTPPTT
jgi:hypothetical protein